MDSNLETRLKEAVKKVCPEVLGLRHQLHQFPELAGEEHQTAALIRNTLAGSRIQLLKPFLKTDVVGLLQGRKPGRNVTLRADMDALPLLEKNNFAHASKIKGCMHACGHDGHTAMLLGAARVLEQFTGDFAGSVRFVFQPGEEVAALGKDCWQLAPYPNMGAEDFAYYLQKHRGAMFWIGLGEKYWSLHNPNFDFNDRVIRNGVLFLAGCALDSLAI